ncbi:hypothetical protein ABPG72_001857 [Tetrahymena utriculariae]
MNNLINLLLIFLSKLLSESLSLQLIKNCESQIIVQYYYYPQMYQQPVCQECQTGFIVDYDFKSCSNATSMPMAYYSYCQRLDRNRECNEALCTIQIDQNKLFQQENHQQYDPRCAKIDTLSKVCLSPTFPYTLDISQNQIIHNIPNYCKIFEGKYCLQNYETFYQIGSFNYYYKVGYFQNIGLIDTNIINFESIKCVNNFKYDSLTPGCFPLKFNCLKNDGKTCLCSDGEAVDSTGSSCSRIQNCLIYGYAGQIKYCMKCKPGFASNQFESSIQNQCQLTIPISPSLNITFSEMPKCQAGEQYNQQSLQWINLYKFDPTYLHLLGQSVQFYSNSVYTQYRPAQSLQCEKLPANTSIVNYCKTYLAGLCIECALYQLYFVQVNNTLQNFSTDYQSFCNYPDIQNCKVVSSDKQQCLVCNENFYVSYGKCVQQNSLCYLINSLDQCFLCTLTYLFNKQIQCVSVLQYCLQYYLSNDGVYYCQIDTNYYGCIIGQNSYCYQCQKGSYLYISNCYNFPILYFCIDFDNILNVCRSCDAQFYLINGVCQYVSQKSSCGIYLYNNSTLSNHNQLIQICLQYQIIFKLMPFQKLKWFLFRLEFLITKILTIQLNSLLLKMLLVQLLRLPRLMFKRNGLELNIKNLLTLVLE